MANQPTHEESNVRIIRDESELPAPPATIERRGEIIPNPIREWAYLRSLCSPTIYVHPLTGENYRRSDGLMWEYPGYRVTLSISGSEVERRGAGAFGDSHQFPYAKQKAAA